MATERPKRGVPEGLWLRCPQCKATVYKKEVESRLHVCPECDHHFTMPARDRIAQLLFTRIARAEFTIVTSFGEADGRQEGGFGSTGIASACPNRAARRQS